MSKKLILAIVVVVVVLIWWGVAKNNPQGDIEVIKIGASLSLTGNFASIGSSERNGLILASEEINKKGGVGGRKIEIIIEDNFGDPKSAVSNVQKLLNIDNVDIIFTAFTPITKAIAPIIKAKKVPMIYAAVDGSIAFENDLIYRDYVDAEQTAVALFKKIKADGAKNIKFLSEQSDAGKIFADALKKEVVLSDIKIVEEVYFQPTEKDFRAYLTKLNLKKDDFLLINAPKHANLIIKNIFNLGLIETPTYQFLAPFLAASKEPDITELFTKNKTISSWYGFADNNNTEDQEKFIINYKNRFNEVPIEDGSFAYDDVYILANILNKCFSKNAVDNNCFKLQMSSLDYNGVAGKVSFDEHGRSNRETLIIQAKNNEWVTVK
ncbi:MAG: ABC transporter substrate-binding protein [bacterium]